MQITDFQLEVLDLNNLFNLSSKSSLFKRHTNLNIQFTYFEWFIYSF